MLTILQGDALAKLLELPDESVHMCCTSPPYWSLRDYSCDDQLGLEKTPEEYVAKMVEVFREVRRVLRADATCWINMGDSIVNKQLQGIPWRLAFALQADGAASPEHMRTIERIITAITASYDTRDEWPDRIRAEVESLEREWIDAHRGGWWLRSDIIWHKPNPMPESCTDRPTKSHEYLFLLTKSASYFYDAEAIKERGVIPEGTLGAKGSEERFGMNGVNSRPPEYKLYDGTRNKRSVWTVATAPFSDWTETARWKRVEAGARGDDTRRIVSPNSQADGGLFDVLATVLDDAHANASPYRIADICDRLSLRPLDGYVSSETLRNYYFGDENLDSFLRRHVFSAMRRNNETNKMGLFVATNPSCMPSEERLDRIRRILARLGWSEPDLDMLLSNTLPDDWPVHLWAKTLYRIGGTSSCEGRYRKTSEMSSHFATYPPDLIKPCILAGTSAKGCCAKCGAPWERVVESVKRPRGDCFGNRDGSFDRGQAGSAYMEKVSTKTTGWQPTCECFGRFVTERIPEQDYFVTIKKYIPGDIPPALVPCTCMDPFAGSGTTGQVALELGRKAILIELNPKYVELIKRRCDVTPGLALA